MEENPFVNVKYSPVKHAASRFSVRKNVTHTQKKKGQKEWHLDGLISQVQVLSVFHPEAPCTTLCWLYITLINPLNVVSTNNFSWATNFIISYYVVYKRPETAATCLNKQFRHNSFVLPPQLSRGNKCYFRLSLRIRK